MPRQRCSCAGGCAFAAEHGGHAPQPGQCAAGHRALRRRPGRPIWKLLALDSNLAMAHAHLGLTLQQDNVDGTSARMVEKSHGSRAEATPRSGSISPKPTMNSRSRAKPILCWRCVLELGEDRAGPHLSLGWALQEEGQRGRSDRTLPCGRTAAPDGGHAADEPGGRLRRARQAGRGRGSLARGDSLAAAVRAAACPAGDAAAWKIERRRSGRLEERIADESIGNGPRARMLFAQAHVLDRGAITPGRRSVCGRPMRLTLELNHKRRDYSPGEHQEFVDMLLERFSPRVF